MPTGEPSIRQKPTKTHIIAGAEMFGHALDQSDSEGGIGAGGGYAVVQAYVLVSCDCYSHLTGTNCRFTEVGLNVLYNVWGFSAT